MNTKQVFSQFNGCDMDGTSLWLTFIVIYNCLINSFWKRLFIEAVMCGIIGREAITLTSGQHKFKRWKAEITKDFRCCIDFILLLTESQLLMRHFLFIIRQLPVSHCPIEKRSSLMLSIQILFYWNALSRWLFLQQWKHSTRMPRFAWSWRS